MENYKVTLKRRLYGVAGYCAVLLVLICLGLFHPTAAGNDRTRAFMAGFNSGLTAVAIVFLVLGVRRYAAALRDADKLKALYIEEHDERLLYIRSKIGGTAVQIVLFGLLAATIAAGFVNEVVYFTLLGALLFAVGVKAGLKIYYHKKIS